MCSSLGRSHCVCFLCWRHARALRSPPLRASSGRHFQLDRQFKSSPFLHTHQMRSRRRLYTPRYLRSRTRRRRRPHTRNLALSRRCKFWRRSRPRKTFVYSSICRSVRTRSRFNVHFAMFTSLLASPRASASSLGLFAVCLRSSGRSTSSEAASHLSASPTFSCWPFCLLPFCVRRCRVSGGCSLISEPQLCS